MSAAVAKSGHPVENIVSDYLSAIIEHLRYILREKLGEGIVRSVPLEFVVTVPAIWSDLAKEKTRQACLLATTLNGASSGSSVRRADPRITLVSEPEAAAIYTLRGLDPHGLRVGDTFVVCDAGGGTVDLISYTISALQPVLEVREAAPGSGALCGSTFLNRRFASFMTAKLGSQEGWDDEMLAEAVDYFEKTVSDLRRFPWASTRSGKLTVQGQTEIHHASTAERDIPHPCRRTPE